MSAQVTNPAATTIPAPVDVICTTRQGLQTLQKQIYYHWAGIREIKMYSYSVTHSRQVKEGIVREAVSSPSTICCDIEGNYNPSLVNRHVLCTAAS
jgi:hypothetical protein